MTVGLIGMTLNLLTSLPLSILPTRKEIFTVIFCKPEEEVGKLFHVLMTIFILWGGAFVSIIYPNILDAFGILGGVNGTLIGITVPGILYFKETERNWYHPKSLVVYVGSFLLTGVGFTAAINSAIGG